MHVLIDDGRDRLTLRRLWPWQRILIAAGEPALLTDGAGPLYRDPAAADLTVLAAHAADVLTW